MAEQKVNIQIQATDNASAVFRSHAEALRHAQQGYESLGDYMRRTEDEAKQAASATDKLTDATDRAGDSATGAGGGFSSLFKSFTLATLAASAIERGVQLVTSSIKDGIEAAANYERSVAGLESTARSFGVTTDQMNASVQNLTADGLLTFGQVATGIKNLLSTGMDIDTAVALMQRFKDEASFGRVESIKFGDAVVNLSEAFLTGSSQMGNLNGHAANFSNAIEIGAAALGKQVAQLSAAETEQAKLIGYMQQGAYTAGNAAQYTDTYAGSLSRMEIESEKASVSLGQALLPAAEYATQSFASFLGSLNSASGGVQELQAYLVTLMAMIRTAAQVAVGAGQVMYGAFKSVAELSWDPFVEGVDQAASGFVDTWDDAYTQWEKIYSEGNDTHVGNFGDALKNMVDLNGGAQGKIQQQIADAVRQFARSMEQRKQAFEASVQDMVIAHRDKSRAIQTDIDKENAAYEKSALKRRQAFDDDIASLEDRHLEKVADIEGQIAEEREKGIQVDGVLFAEANQKKIQKLEEQLGKEQVAYQKAVDKRKGQYAEEAAEDQTRHNERLTQLQTALNQELAILDRHRAEVKAVGEMQKQDDLTRLKAQYAQQTSEAERNHQEQLAKIRQQGSSQGSTYGGAYTNSANASLAKMVDDQKSRLDAMQHQAAQSGSSSAKSLWDNFKSGISQWFKDLPQHFTNTLKNLDKHTGAVSAAALLANLLPNGPVLSNLIKGFTGRATGGKTGYGEKTLVGEHGPEFAEFPAGTRITPAPQTRQILDREGARQLAISIGNVILQNQNDIEAFTSSLAWRIR